MNTQNKVASISLTRIGKSYQIYGKPHHRLMQEIFRGRRKYYRDFWALRDVSLSIRKGETVGIIGRNGSGKSTLLQIICGTLSPTNGKVDINGRVAALLELGAGFDPEFTGRENVYMNASLLGLSKSEIDERFEKIIEFSEIEEHIDQAVKNYSSGMYVRLAFSIVANVDADILIIDEALAVGDEAFQRKCFERIRQIQKKGASILFVSHSAGMIVDLCSRAALFDKGEMLLSGEPKAVVGNYHKMLNAAENDVEKVREHIKSLADDSYMESASVLGGSQASKRHFDNESLHTLWYEPRGAMISNPHITDLEGHETAVLSCGDEYFYCFDVEHHISAYDVVFGLLIKTKTGFELGGAATFDYRGMEEVTDGTKYKVKFRFRCNLNNGVYFVNAGVSSIIDGQRIYLHRGVDVAMFRVIDSCEWSTGLVSFQCTPEISALDQ